MDEKVLADLVVSINLMTYKIFQKLGLGEQKLTTLALQLADQLIRHPSGISEDVLVNVDKIIFSVDFVIFDLDDKVEVPLILRRQSLVMSRIEEWSYRSAKRKWHSSFKILCDNRWILMIHVTLFILFMSV